MAQYIVLLHNHVHIDHVEPDINTIVFLFNQVKSLLFSGGPFFCLKEPPNYFPRNLQRSDPLNGPRKKPEYLYNSSSNFLMGSVGKFPFLMQFWCTVFFHPWVPSGTQEEYSPSFATAKPGFFDPKPPGFSTRQRLGAR